MVWSIAKYMAKALFLAGHDLVIIDATNATKHRRDYWKPFYDSEDWELIFKHFSTSKEECIMRAKKDNREDLIPIIERTAENFDLEGVEFD